MGNQLENRHWKMLRLGFSIELTLCFCGIFSSPLFASIGYEESLIFFIISCLLGLSLIPLYGEYNEIMNNPNKWLKFYNEDIWFQRGIFGCLASFYVIPCMMVFYSPLVSTWAKSLTLLYFVVSIIGFIMYGIGRHSIDDVLRGESSQRRRGKRSHIKKEDILSMSEDEEVNKICEVLATDINFRNRTLAAELLKEQDTPNVIETLQKGLLDEEQSVQLACAISLLSIGYHDGKEIFEEIFRDGYESDRIKVVKAVRTVDADWAVTILNLATDDESEEIRRLVS